MNPHTKQGLTSLKSAEGACPCCGVGVKVLITGGAGFIGSHLTDKLIEKRHKVAVIDNFSTGRKENLNCKAEFYQADICAPGISRIFEKEKPDIVFHLAALISAVESLQRPEETMKINSQGTLNILEASFKNKVKKIIFASSCAVYGDSSYSDEIAPLNPKSPYATSKIEAENYLEEFLKKGLKTASLRYFNVYGPRQNPDSPYSAVIPIFIKNALNSKPLIIYGDGNQTRDFIFVDDVVKANELLMRQDREGVFNVGSGIERTINELARVIIDLSKSKSEIIYQPARKGDIYQSRADISKIKKLGWKPEVKLEQGLKILIENAKR